MKNIALILASGKGERSGLNQPKQFYEVGGKTLLEHALTAFENHEAIDEIIVVSHPDLLERTKRLVSGFSKVCSVVAGGETRQQSSYNGVFSVGDIEANVLIHDAVRAFVSRDIISACVEGLKEHDAVCAAIETPDTILEIDENGRIAAVPQRKLLRCAQTPQCFRLNLIRQAHNLACRHSVNVTDDCGLILASKLADIYVVAGNTDNQKITYPRDLELAKLIYEKKT